MALGARRTGLERLVMREVGFVAAELTGVGAGLLLALGLGDWLAGALVLLAVCAASCSLRFRHYSQSAPATVDPDGRSPAPGWTPTCLAIQRIHRIR